MNVTECELQAKATKAKELGAHVVVITGQWVRAEFANKPSKEIREQLKAERFVWLPVRQQWVFMGRTSTAKRTMPWSYITEKYGLVMVQDEVTA